MSCEILSSILAFLTAQNPQEVFKKSSSFIEDNYFLYNWLQHSTGHMTTLDQPEHLYCCFVLLLCFWLDKSEQNMSHRKSHLSAECKLFSKLVQIFFFLSISYIGYKVSRVTEIWHMSKILQFFWGVYFLKCS